MEEEKNGDYTSIGKRMAFIRSYQDQILRAADFLNSHIKYGYSQCIRK